MEFKYYQNMAKRFAVYPKQQLVNNVLYLGLGLAGECGEVANKLKKIIRDDSGIITAERKQQLIDELGDALWYISQICVELGISFDIIALANIAKLRQRKDNDTLRGSGDNR